MPRNMADVRRQQGREEIVLGSAVQDAIPPLPPPPDPAEQTVYGSAVPDLPPPPEPDTISVDELVDP